jgi:hypothetical protein
VLTEEDLHNCLRLASRACCIRQRNLPPWRHAVSPAGVRRGHTTTPHRCLLLQMPWRYWRHTEYCRSLVTVGTDYWMEWKWNMIRNSGEGGTHPCFRPMHTQQKPNFKYSHWKRKKKIQAQNLSRTTGG